MSANAPGTPFPNDPGVLSLPAVTVESLGAPTDGVSDASVAFQRAANLGRVRITCASPAYSFSSSVTPKGGNYWDLEGVTLNQLPGLTTGIFDKAPGGAQDTTVTFWGGSYAGNGVTGAIAFRDGIRLSDFDQVWVLGGNFTNFADSAVQAFNCSRAYLLFNVIHDCCESGQRNAIIFRDDANNQGQNPTTDTDFVAIGNIIFNVPTAGVSIVGSNGGGSRALIALNDITSTGSFAAISLELNTYNAGAGESQWHNLIIALNYGATTGTGNSATALTMVDDGPNPFADSFKLADVLILGNYWSNNANGAGGNGACMDLQISRATVIGNYSRALGTSGQCVYVTANPAANPVSQLHFSANHCLQDNPAPQNPIVSFRNATDWSWSGGRIASSAAAQPTVNSAHGFYIDSSCSRWTLDGFTIDNAGNNGLHTVSWIDGTVRALKIRNANASNTASTSNSNGIYTPAAAGTLNEASDISIVDDRGTHQMTFGWQGPGAPATTKIKIKGLTIVGALTLPMTTTTVANMIDEIVGYSSNVMTGYGLNATANTAGASPFTTTPQPYDQHLSVNTTGGMTAMSYSRNSIALPTAAGTGVLIRRGESVTMTWATTAPTFGLTPLP